MGIPLTPGEDGLAARLGIEFSPTHRIVFLFYLIAALALLTNWVTIRLRRLPIGRAWEALREDEVACRALAAKVPGICPKFADDFSVKSADNAPGFTRRAGCFP